MHALSKLDASGIDDAANSVFLWLSVYLFMAVVSIYKIAKTIMKHAYETTAERVSDGTKLFAGMMIIFGLFIALAPSGDTFELAVTFPAWGTLIFLLVFFLVWIATRWFFLNRDDIASYTIEAGRRTNIDEQWNKQTKVKGSY
ncbi:MAG TPA: hypothetical protein VK627_06135 [Edaphobacter sp.]|nr:hypothetical protein [Edaphobacter sp.]